MIISDKVKQFFIRLFCKHEKNTHDVELDWRRGFEARIVGAMGKGKEWQEAEWLGNAIKFEWPFLKEKRCDKCNILI